MGRAGWSKPQTGKTKVKAPIPYIMTSEPSQKCANCGQPMTAWMIVNVDKKWVHPEKIGTMDQPRGTRDERWCLACIRGKKDPAWFNLK